MAVLEPGQAFAGYQIVEVAGQGGMGVVYRATQARLKRTVALKLIAPELARDKEFRARFEQESETAASIEHPNVIPIYDSGEVDGTLFLAMRFIEGLDLRDQIEEGGPLDPMRAARIVEQVAAALDAAHENGLVHRDVKPRNILIADHRGGDHVYLTDFGLTKEAASTEGMTRTGQWVGTIDYVSPEQIEGRPVDARADVYSLGCVLFECLTGRVPFERDSQMARLLAHINDPAPRVSERRSGISPQFDQVIERALAKAPEDRYPSAGDLGRAAVAAGEGKVTTAPEGSVAAGAAAPGGRSRTAPARTRVARRRAASETAAAAPARGEGRRRMLTIAGGGAAAIALVILLVVLLTGGGDSSSEAAVPDPDPGSVPKPAPDGNGIVPGSSLVGVWQGTARQFGPQSTSYPVVMDISPQPTSDGSSGTINYPSYPCGGRVTIVDTGEAPIGTRYEMDEEITRNTTKCTPGHITADLQGSELRWHWNLDKYNAFAVLRRLDAPAVQKRLHPELSTDDLALIDGSHKGTVTGYGPGTDVTRFPVIVDIKSSDQPLPPGSVVGLTVNPQGGCRGELRLTERYDRVFVFRETASGRGASRCLFYDRLEIVPWGDDLVIRGSTVAPKTFIDGVLHAVSGG